MLIVKTAENRVDKGQDKMYNYGGITRRNFTKKFGL